MASLKEQINWLTPLLDATISPEELELSLLKLYERKHYESNKCNLLYQLSIMRSQASIYCYPSRSGEDDIFEKVNQLLALEGSTLQVGFSITDGEHNLLLNDKIIRLGKHGIYRWQINADKILVIPGFYRNIALAMKDLLKQGRFYFGYLKDEDMRKSQVVVFVIFFIKTGFESILQEYSEMSWHLLGEPSTDQTIESVVFSEGQKGNFTFSYRSKFTNMTTVVILLAAMAGFGTVNKFVTILDHQLPDRWLLAAALVMIVLGVLDYFNRKVTLRLAAGRLELDQGVLPFLPGYRRLKIPTSNIVRVWTKKKTDLDSWSEAAATITYSTALHITTIDSKEIQLTSDIEETEASFIKGKIEECLQINKGD